MAVQIEHAWAIFIGPIHLWTSGRALGYLLQTHLYLKAHITSHVIRAGVHLHAHKTLHRQAWLCYIYKSNKQINIICCMYCYCCRQQVNYAAIWWRRIRLSLIHRSSALHVTPFGDHWFKVLRSSSSKIGSLKTSQQMWRALDTPHIKWSPLRDCSSHKC